MKVPLLSSPRENSSKHHQKSSDTKDRNRKRALKKWEALLEEEEDGPKIEEGTMMPLSQMNRTNPKKDDYVLLNCVDEKASCPAARKAPLKGTVEERRFLQVAAIANYHHYCYPDFAVWKMTSLTCCCDHLTLLYSAHIFSIFRDC